MKNKIYLGFGSNIGDRRANIIAGLSFLQSCGFVDILRCSSFYETSAVGKKQKDFINAAAEAATSLSAKELLSHVKQAERLLGRKVSFRRGPRLIDIDIFFYGSLVLNSKKPYLSIPHKEIQNRLFALMPLAEIAPDFIHPVFNMKIERILEVKKLTLALQKVKIIRI